MTYNIIYILFFIVFIVIIIKISHNKKNNIISQIMPHIFLSSYNTANNHHILKKYNIKYILTILPKNNIYNDYKMKYYPDIKYMQIDKHDDLSENIKSSFDEAIKFIDEAVRHNKNILVHCHAGVSRSPTIVAAYLMKKFCISRNDALNIIKNNRKFIKPNFGFMEQLSQYEQENSSCKIKK